GVSADQAHPPGQDPQPQVAIRLDPGHRRRLPRGFGTLINLTLTHPINPSTTRPTLALWPCRRLDAARLASVHSMGISFRTWGPSPMTQRLLFAPELPLQAARLAPRLHALADRGVYFGSTSWKFEGWIGSVYTRERYLVRGKFSRRKFEADCLKEYAAT